MGIAKSYSYEWGDLLQLKKISYQSQAVYQAYVEHILTAQASYPHQYAHPINFAYTHSETSIY